MELVQIYFKKFKNHAIIFQFPCIFSVFILKIFLLDPNP